MVAPCLRICVHSGLLQRNVSWLPPRKPRHGGVQASSGEKDHLIGMITDRDIAIRGIAKGKGPKAKVPDVMTDTSSTASMIRRSKRSSTISPTSRCDVSRSSIATSVARKLRKSH
jgi:hypothetical protein